MTTAPIPAPDSVHLFLTEGTSDKEYRLDLSETPGGWEVVARYGKRGSALKEHKKTPAPVSFEAARKEYDKAMSSKLKEGYTIDPSGARAQPVPDIGLLKGRHKVLTKPDCHDFRVPNLAWVHGQSDDFDELIFSNVTSEFWIGPSSDARTFAEQVTAQYAAWAPTLSTPSSAAPSSSTGNASEIAVAYWENVELGMSMVAVIPYYDTYAWVKKERDCKVPAVNAFPSMRMLGFDGNDNCASELASALCDYVDSGDIAQEEGRDIARFLLSMTIREYQDEVKEQLDEEFPGWKGKKKTPKAS